MTGSKQSNKVKHCSQFWSLAGLWKRCSTARTRAQYCTASTGNRAIAFFLLSMYIIDQVGKLSVACNALRKALSMVPG